MADIVDLDILFPENDIIKFKDRSGQVYEISLFIPAAVGFTLLDNIDMIKSIFPVPGGRPRLSKEAIEMVLRILADICNEQHPEIDREWIKKNVSLPRQAYIIYKMAKPIYDFLTDSGFLEAVRP